MRQLGLQAQSNKSQGGDWPRLTPRIHKGQCALAQAVPPAMRACPGLPAQESRDSFQQYPPRVLPQRDRV